MPGLSLQTLFPMQCERESVSGSVMSRLFVTPWTVAHQAPLSIGFSRQEYWSGFPFPSPGDLPNPGIEPMSPALQADSLWYEPLGKLTLCETADTCAQFFSFNYLFF